MINLQPTNTITYPLNWTAKSIEITINAFPLFPNTVEVFWKINGNSTSFSGSTIIPNDVVSKWGTDDSIIKEYVLNQLGLLEALAPELIDETSTNEEPIA